MANTGILQATIAYKVTQDGQPLDVDGNLTLISGKRQAIALLEGRANPNPATYEVELYFKPKDIIGGESTATTDVVTCPLHFIRADKLRVLLTPSNPSQTITIFSSASWVSQVNPIATLTPSTGQQGATVLTLTRTSTLGAEYFTFVNSATGQEIKVYVINVENVDEWILTNGTWNALGFWKNNGVWNY